MKVIRERSFNLWIEPMGQWNRSGKRKEKKSRNPCREMRVMGLLVIEKVVGRISTRPVATPMFLCVWLCVVPQGVVSPVRLVLWAMARMARAFGFILSSITRHERWQTRSISRSAKTEMGPRHAPAGTGREPDGGRGQ